MAETENLPGMGQDRKPRSPKAAPLGVAEDKAGDSEQITYTPGPDDPVSTKWHGHVFHANVPKTVTNPEFLKKLRETPNPFFKIGAFNPDTDKAPAETFIGEPKTSEQYRAHAVGWLKKCADIEDLAKTWIAEQRLREMCEVGHDDYAWLGTIFLPKMHSLARAAELSETQVADLWKRYGVFQLPF